MKTINYLMPALIMGIMLTSCKKIEEFTNSKSSKTQSTGGSNSQTASYSIRMTDAPGPYSEVNIDLIGVRVLCEDGTDTMMSVNAGIYNLLDFANGLDTVIAKSIFDTCTITQIRLILGPNNTVVIDSVSYPLSTPSAQQSGLKIQIHQVLAAGTNVSTLLDFDANQSIIKQGNGTYKLKPVIRVVDSTSSGVIKGVITPKGVAATVTATSGSNSYSTVVNTNGQFTLKGVPAGTYDVTITPAAPYLPVTITGVIVNKGRPINLGTISL